MCRVSLIAGLTLDWIRLDWNLKVHFVCSEIGKSLPGMFILALPRTLLVTQGRADELVTEDMATCVRGI